MGSRVLLSDERVARRIREEFVPATGEHNLLGRGPLRDWFVSMVRSADPRFTDPSRMTTQGYYVVGADGTGHLRDMNTFSVDRLRNFIDRGLTLWRANPGRGQDVSEADLRDGEAAAAPEGAAVLRLFNRIRPVPEGAHMTNERLGVDYMWIPRNEIRAIVRSSSERTFSLPRALVSRLVLYHMVDNVRGQVWSWQPDSVERVQFEARVASRRGATLTVAFAGEYAKRDSHPPQWNDRGQEGRIEGEFTIDAGSLELSRFRAYGEAQAWSDATYTPYSPPRGRYTLVTAIVDAPEEVAREVTPEPAAGGAIERYLGLVLPAVR